MTADPRLPELFAAASELEGEARAAWLAGLRREDEALAREVEELLAASAADAGRFETPAWERLPPQIGPYRIRREIGRGGMGRVFLAEQEGAEFRRTVALKIIDRPMTAEDTVRHFRDEARILAGLEHPGIARFYDAGRTEDGSWFLALEYVEGEDLLTFVRRRNPDLRARVELFLQVLDAVDFAHRRLVVHRDLKPANVLVGADGRARLLDFGISKIVDPDADDSQVTRTELRAFTPAYASPEQLRGERATVATDVFSLGVMLYEILAGRRPFTRRTAAPLERDPEPPSTAARQPTASPEDERQPATLVRWRDLVGDLDAITLKALRAEPESRYRSAAALADDLRRWLAGEPVEARRGGRRYRLAKFVVRHRLPVAFAALAVLALAAGLAGTLVQSRRATRQAAIAREQRDFALRQLSRAEALNELNTFLLSDAAPGGKPFTVGDLLAQAEQIVERERGETAENRAEILIAIGWHYQNLEDLTKAIRVLTAAHDLAPAGPDRSTRAKAACALASTVIRTGEFERAERLIAEGLEEMPEAPQFIFDRIFCLLRAGEVAREKDPRLAVERVEAAQRLVQQAGRGSSMLALSVNMELAESYRNAGRNREAFAAFEQASARLEAAGRGRTLAAATVLNNWGLVARSLGQPLKAEQLYRRALEISSSEGEEHVSPAILNSLARCLTDLDRLLEARDYAGRVDTLARRNGDEIILNQNLFLRLSVERQLGHLDQAASILAELVPRVKSTYPPEHVAAVSLISEQGLLAQARGDVETARAAQDRAIALAETNDHDEFLPRLLLRRSDLELARHHPESARADAAQALALEQRAAEKGAPSCRIGRAHLALGRALLALGKPTEARAAFTAAGEHLEPTLGAGHPETREARRFSRQLSVEVAGNKS